MIADVGTRLRPATVVRAEGDRLLLEGLGWARLACPYRLGPGDEVLAIGEEELFVLGVLKARDLELRAEGTVRIVGGKGVEIEAPDVTVKADRIETIARAIFERCVNGYRWFKEVLQTRAGRTRTVVEGHATLQAERIVETAEKDVKIDGERIYLG